MIHKTLTAFTLLLLSFTPLAEAQEAPLDQYIQQALESNIALQQQQLSYEASLAALEEAKAMFFPTLSIQARYSVARGGRAFTIPVGDLVNPIYQNLNLINDMAQDVNPNYPDIPEYPMISNVEENFLRETEQETVVRLQMPVFNSAILHNQRIRQNLAEADRIGVKVYKRELVKEVKQAYFKYAQAQQGVAIMQEALRLVNENLRTNESLQRNHKITLDVVYSAQAEVQEVEQQLAEAEKNEQTAKAYFNFLLNRDYEAEISVPEAAQFEESAASLEAAQTQAFQQREELQQLNYFLAANDQQVSLNKGSRLPQVNLQADYGVQGVDYNIDSDSDFFLGSVVMSWNLFDRSTSARVQKAKVERARVEQQQQEVKRQIGLQAIQAYYELEAARKQITTAKAEVEAARQAFRLVNKKYEQGQANLVTFTNARTQLTNAKQNYSIAVFGYQEQLAEYERVVAGYEF